jgi:sugar/nucleoside kinase (ribokinase family)
VAGATEEPIDVLGIGVVAVDDLIFLEGFPPPDSKMPVARRERHAGGLTGTALVAARRMGARCAYSGVLGDDELSRFVLDSLAAEGVSVGSVVRRQGARPYHSTILIDTTTKTRTILFDSLGVVGPDPERLPEKEILSAGVLLVDHLGLAGTVRAARLARGAGIPVVADLEVSSAPLLSELIGLVDHLIVPWNIGVELTGAADGPAVARGLWEARTDARTGGRSAVVVTRGTEGSWCMSAERPGKVFHQPSFRVETVDTTGCGDVFHGAYAAALREGRPVEERLRFAAAVAALKATRVGGQKGIPTRGEVEKFLGERSGEARGEWA